MADRVPSERHLATHEHAMTQPPFLSADNMEKAFDWPDVIAALRQGHRLGRVRPRDLLIDYGGNNLLTRACAIAGLGSGVKAVTIHPDNRSSSPPAPTVQGVYVLFDDADGRVLALMDGAWLTWWKTAADSVLGAQLLANPDPKCITVIGSGTVASSLVEAYLACFQTIERVIICSRKPDSASALAERMRLNSTEVSASSDAAGAVAVSDIVCCATGSTRPVLEGALVSPGTHVDLVGAHAPDMREADDELMRTGRIFVDCVDTTVSHIGELIHPLREGVISSETQIHDLYDLLASESVSMGRQHADDITVFKNGGGAHLDLMVARLIHSRWLQLNPNQ